MFKCKQCGRQFGANTPRHCPDCGVRHDRSAKSSLGILYRIALGSLIDVVGWIVLVAILLWFAFG